MIDHIGGWAGTNGGASAYYFHPSHSGGLSKFNSIILNQDNDAHVLFRLVKVRVSINENI